jgi:hypothetical protein
LKGGFATLKRRRLKRFVAEETLMDNVIAVLEQESFVGGGWK